MEGPFVLLLIQLCLEFRNNYMGGLQFWDGRARTL